MRLSKESPRTVLVENEHIVVKLRKWLPKGPTEDGEGFRQHDLVQFVAKHGGVRTCRANNLTLI